ncbi:MAG: lipopolysaccharide heptosyltransferase family protein, partial [FCB group bacterium]
MKILIVQLGRIGDMILATPMFRAVREKYPDAEIHVLAGKHNFFVINNNPRIDKIYIHKKNPFNIIKNILALKKEKYDYWLDAKDHY